MIFSRTAVLLALFSSVNAFAPAAMPGSSTLSMAQSQTRSCLLMVDKSGDFDNEDEGVQEEDYIVKLGELENGDQDDDDLEVVDDGEPPSWAASKLRKEELQNTHRRHEKDTGSPEFQVAGMTERISYLTTHLQKQPKDVSTRRGLVALVNKRRRLLNYLYSENETVYVELVKSLGIRHKAPGRVEDRNDKYSRFPKQKSVRKHLNKN